MNNKQALDLIGLISYDTFIWSVVLRFGRHRLMCWLLVKPPLAYLVVSNVRLKCWLKWWMVKPKVFVHGNVSFINSNGVNCFVWVSLMNSIWTSYQLICSLCGCFPALGINAKSHHRVVLQDLIWNGTLGISVGVFFLMIYYSFKIKG